MKHATLFELNTRLELYRRRLDAAWRKWGLSDPRTIALSVRLDRLHTEIQRGMMA